MGFERYTDRARRAIVLANDEARMAGTTEVTTACVLAGLLHEGGGVAFQALAAFGLTLEDARTVLLKATGQEVRGHIPFSTRAKDALRLADLEATDLKTPYVGTEHLLLGLVREGDSTGISVLAALGVNRAEVREQVLDLLRGYEQQSNAEWHTVDAVGVEFKDSCMLYGPSLAHVLSAHARQHQQEVPDD